MAREPRGSLRRLQASVGSGRQQPPNFIDRQSTELVPPTASRIGRLEMRPSHPAMLLDNEINGTVDGHLRTGLLDPHVGPPSHCRAAPGHEVERLPRVGSGRGRLPVR